MEGEVHTRTLLLLISGLLAISSPAAWAEDVLIMDPQIALSSDEFKAGLGNDVAFYFTGAATPAVKTDMEEFLVDRVTRRSSGPPETNCRRVLLAAFLDFQARARKKGGNAVVNMVSFYRKHYAADSTMVECHITFEVKARIVLRGTVAQIDK